MIRPSVDIGTAVKDTINYFRRKRAQKIPVGQFFKQVEKRYRIRLSGESKDDILSVLQARGEITVLKSRNGHVYIVFGELDF